jgi:hypothetical protein
MKKMQVYLSEEAKQFISALHCCLNKTNADGFLIGHKRGAMFVVERILPSSSGFFSSPEKYFELKNMLDDRILGFYSFRTNETKLKKILTPFAFGKIFLSLDLENSDRLEIKPFVIEHDRKFHLQPINLRSTL